jgi:putative metal-binding protein
MKSFRALLFPVASAGVLALAPLVMLACNSGLIEIGGACNPADPNCGNGSGGGSGVGSGAGGSSGVGGQSSSGQGDVGGGPLCPNPSPEICDGIDNDCDGLVDENGNGLLICPNGSICINGSCQGACNPAGLDVCDGIDNDCDGAIDNGATCPDPAQQCLNGTCQPCQPNMVEACDGVDNDCDGVIDNGAFCPNGDICVNGACGGCVPAVEACDGIDNDCDGVIDNAATCPNPNDFCTNGVCGGGGCIASPEVCDGVDNNCNGLTDEQNGLLLCPGGACVNGMCTGCQPNGAEVCDGTDNNCDGVVDNGATCPNPNQICLNGACSP